MESKNDINQNPLNDEEKRIRKEKIEFYTNQYRNELKLGMDEIKSRIYRSEHTRKAIAAVKHLKRLNVRLNEKGIKYLEQFVLHDHSEEFVDNVQLVVDLYVKNEDESSALKFINNAINSEKKYQFDLRLKKMKQQIEDISIERDVILFLQEGKTTSQIAERLGKSEIEIIRMKNKYQARQKEEENER